MTLRISPLWWPALTIASPVLLPMLWIKNKRFIKDIFQVQQLNRERIKHAPPIAIPELTEFKITVLTEEKSQPGFRGSPGISYKIKTDKGALLFDLGFGPEEPGLSQNAKKLNFTLDQVDAVAVSHLHPDHMGGFAAMKKNQLFLPESFGKPNGIPCFLPAPAAAEGFKPEIVQHPQQLAAGIVSTGPLARSLFLMGRTEEQSLIGRIKGKGLIIIVGCGHPTIQKIIEMVRQITCEPVYAICGGFHMPVTDSPLKKPGLKVQMIWGTGKPPWKKITDQDLDHTVEALNRSKVKKILLSHHDCCGHVATRMEKELTADVEILRAGASYHL